jgi:ABC-2 type transport system ATP-binding protein
MIKVKNLSKTFKVHTKEPGFVGSLKSLFSRKYITKQALNNISLTVNSGEIIGLIGSNGAGKTTLTKILSGIIHPTSGEVSVVGFDPWKKDNRYRSQMSLIMGQKAQLWWDLPAMDGFLLLKEIYKIPEQEFYESVNYLSECLMVTDQLKIQVRKLSLGERMKVELIAALLHKPKVVFLDEPTIGLDLLAQKAVRKFIKEYREKYKPIMILTSHYMEDIEELCERVVIMKEGSFIFDGSIEKIKKDFATNRLIKASISLEDFEKAKALKFDQCETTFNGGIITIHAPKELAIEVSKNLMNSVKVIDLNIQEEDIGSIIEEIMKKEIKR